MEDENSQLISRLALLALDMAGHSANDLERCCWVLVHEHRHGVKPVEYDIREIDEALFVAVLERARSEELLDS